MTLNLHGIHNDMLTSGISFCFTGYMSEEVLMGIGNTLRKKFEIDELDKSTSNSMFSVFVEMVQNVIRYSAENQADSNEPAIIDLRYGILSIGERDGRKFIACGNIIEKQHVARLSENLTNLQGMDKDELRRHFRQSLRDEIPEGSKGAGVGFIEIARRATHGFDFGFEPVGDDREFFTISAYL